MPALAYSAFDALPDALGIDRFEILLSPASAPNLNQVLALRCTQIAIPQEMIEVMPVAVQGMTFNYRGRRTYGTKLAAAFVEMSDAAVTTGVGTWMQSIVGSESQNGASKKQYATLGTLNVFDQSGNTAVTILIDNIWPDDSPDIQLDGGQSSAMNKTMSFTFDRFRNQAVSIT